MPRLATVFYTLYARLLLIVVLLLLAIPLGICLLLPSKLLVDNRLFKEVVRFFYWSCIKCSLLPITYSGLENIPATPCIIAANHQSSFDIPLVGYAMGAKPHIWLAWSELARSLLLRFMLPRNAILVDPASPIGSMRSLIHALALIKAKPWDLIIFPEGARHTDGAVHEFFGGFVLLAKKIERPVVPIKIQGASTVYPPDTFWIYYNPIKVTIGQPMSIQPDETDQLFKQRVQNWFLQN